MMFWNETPNKYEQLIEWYWVSMPWRPQWIWKRIYLLGRWSGLVFYCHSWNIIELDSYIHYHKKQGIASLLQLLSGGLIYIWYHLPIYHNCKPKFHETIWNGNKILPHNLSTPNAPPETHQFYCVHIHNRFGLLWTVFIGY